MTARTARDDGSNKVQSLSKLVNFNTTGIGTADTVKLGTLPAGAQIMSCIVRIKTAFNAVTTNVLTVGSSAGSDADVVGANDVNEGITGTVIVVTAAGLDFSADTDIFVKYVQTGTAATTGQALIVLTYVSTNNDSAR